MPWPSSYALEWKARDLSLPIFRVSSNCRVLGNVILPLSASLVPRIDSGPWKTRMESAGFMYKLNACFPKYPGEEVIIAKKASQEAINGVSL